MAEFVQVMSQFMRMCDSFKDCDNCPVFQEGFSCDCDHQGYSKTGAEEIEHIIMAWAAEHPEPVYPTWYAWLANMGIVPIELPPDQAIMITDIGLLKKIPADIAQKLGIELKEVR